MLPNIVNIFVKNKYSLSINIVSSFLIYLILQLLCQYFSSNLKLILNCPFKIFCSTYTFELCAILFFSLFINCSTSILTYHIAMLSNFAVFFYYLFIYNLLTIDQTKNRFSVPYIYFIISISYTIAHNFAYM